MFEELLFMFGFLILSLVAKYIMLRALPSPCNMILFAFAIVGVVFHEICHRFMCFITRTPVERVSLLKKIPTQKPDRFSLGGEVILKEEERRSFLKAFLIGLAPTYICFWAFWFFWGQIVNAGLDELMIFLYILLMCSLVLGAAPSLGDLKSIVTAFSRDAYHSMYQIILIGASMLTVWFLLYIYQFQVVHEIFNYLFFAAGYAVYRYSILGVYTVIQKLYSRPRPMAQKSASVHQLTRRRHKPMKPEEAGIEEPHW